MDIKEFKNNIITGIKSKLATVINSQDFEKKILSKCYQYRNGKTIEELLKRNYHVIHFPLLLVLDPSHDYTKRYVSHMIEFNLQGYIKNKNNDDFNINDYVDIVTGPYSALTHLKNRSVETLLSMNMALLTYDEVVNFKSKQELEMIKKFKKGTLVLCSGLYYKLTEDIAMSFDRKKYKIRGKILNTTPLTDNFGRFQNYEHIVDIRDNEINNKLSVVTVETVKDYLKCKVNEAVIRKNSRLTELERVKKQVQKEITTLQNYDVNSMSFEPK